VARGPRPHLAVVVPVRDEVKAIGRADTGRGAASLRASRNWGDEDRQRVSDQCR
jgi:hypothetical protein